MSLADRCDQILDQAQRRTASATAAYDQRVAALGERVRIRAENDGHRRGVTREAVARSGAILLPADAIDLSPHSPVPDPEVVPESGRRDADEPVVDATASANADPDPIDPDPIAADPAAADSSFASGWLTDR